MVALHGSFLTEVERVEMQADLDAAVVVRAERRDKLAQLGRDGLLSDGWRWKLLRQVEVLSAHIARYRRDLSA